tara:strand:- start:3490 stop:3666 length:177 start_codon:yes stop_codon:yes gene_type:complete
MKELQLLASAINKANLKGVYNLQESVNINAALQALAGVLESSEEVKDSSPVLEMPKSE